MLQSLSINKWDKFAHYTFINFRDFNIGTCYIELIQKSLILNFTYLENTQPFSTIPRIFKFRYVYGHKQYYNYEFRYSLIDHVQIFSIQVMMSTIHLT